MDSSTFAAISDFLRNAVLPDTLRSHTVFNYGWRWYLSEQGLGDYYASEYEQPYLQTGYAEAKRFIEAEP